MADDTISIEINGQAYGARKGQMVIEVADAAGIDIPRFCYHPKLSVAANCRMCLVEVERAPKPLPACATPVMDGMKVYTRSPLALKAQKSVMEFLLINHPLDCPICDQGGECELQDVAMGYGRDVSRFVERKRVVEDKNIGPLIATDMTRCIHCTRCVRFGEEIGGMPELGATGRGENIEIGTYIEQSVESEMSGNVIDLCPVGALTSKPFRFRARAWEMQQRKSIAPHDSVGSNIHLHIGQNRVLRVAPRDNEAINEAWISDRDRFSYEGLYASDRLTEPMVKRDGRWSAVDWETALAFAADGLKAAAEKRPTGFGALGTPSATLEELYLLQKLVRGLGSSNVDHRLRQADFGDQDHAPPYPSLGCRISGLEELDAVLLIGANTRKEHPIVNHRLRKASQRGARVFVLNPLDYDFNFEVQGRAITPPSQIPEALLCIAAAARASDDVKHQEAIGDLHEGVNPGEIHETIARALLDAERAAIILGPSALNHPSASYLRGVAAALAKMSGSALGLLTEGANAAGAWLAGAVPHRGPATASLDTPGAHAAGMLEDPLDAYVLLGVEPERDCGNPAAARRALAGAGFVVSLTAYRTDAMDEYADALLPIAGFAETSGTYVNMEGTWQSFEGSLPAPGESRPAWKVLRVLGNLLELGGFDQVASTEVRDELRGLVGESGPVQSPWPLPSSTPDKLDGTERVGDVPIYAVDPVVRRAPALQRTRDAALAEATVSASFAMTLGLKAGDKVALRQNGHAATALLGIDPSVPDGCVRVPSGMPASEALGPAFGPMEISKA